MTSAFTSQRRPIRRYLSLSLRNDATFTSASCFDFIYYQIAFSNPRLSLTFHACFLAGFVLRALFLLACCDALRPEMDGTLIHESNVSESAGLPRFN
jgi:hypothetical protein